jgi:heterodisulfide reductase subunit A-like polyferredoxin
VLVLGGGPAGIEAASRLQALGHPVTVVAGEPEERIAPATVAGLARSVRLLAGSRLRSLEGQIGAFTARVQTPAGEVAVSAGAVIVAGGGESFPTVTGGASGDGSPTPPLAGLEEAVAALPRRAGTRSVGILLDLELDESRASSERALRLALRLQQRDRVQVYLFCRDVRVAALPLEELYDEARQAGVEIVKYAGAPRLSPGARGVTVRVQDQVLGEPLELRCDLLGVSPSGLRPALHGGAGTRALAEITGVSTDALGRLQENNVHLFPEKTNRPGVFVAGPGRGEDYPPQAIREGQAAALAAHRLLAPGELDVELSNAAVDADKCALCLTCVRSCPFRAMRVNVEKGAAESIPEVCRKCGICAGECPAKAIELPVYPDRILLSQMR